MQAVILAGGRGIRLRPLDANVPKSMLPLFDRPILEHTIKLLTSHGIDDIIITTSGEATDIPRYFGDGRRFGVKIRYSIEDEPLGTAGALKLVQDKITGTFIALCGDAITDYNLTAAITEHKANSAIATLLVDRVDDPTAFGYVETDHDGKLTRIVEKPDSDKVKDTTVCSGLMILEPEALSSIPPYQACDISMHIIPRMISNQEPVYAIHPSGYWCDAGHALAYRNAHFDALEERLHIDMPATQVAPGIWMGDRVEVHPSVELEGPIYLGSGVVVRQGAVLRPRTIIGEDTLIEEDAQIARCVIGSNCHVSNGASISDCVIGSGYLTSEGESIRECTLVSHVQYEISRAEPVVAATALKTSQQQQRQYQRV